MGQSGDYTEWYFQSIDGKQLMVEKDEHFNYRIALKRHRSGIPDNIQLTLYLFADSTGSAKRNVIKVFHSLRVPPSQREGRYFYGVLPEPAASK
jgi:hypothetical protein